MNCPHCRQYVGHREWCPRFAMNDPARPGVASATELMIATENREQCLRGLHAWVPWLQLPSGSWTTWCAREGCSHCEQYDL